MKSGFDGGNAALQAEFEAIDEALRRLQNQQTYLTAAAAGLARLLLETPAGSNSQSRTKRDGRKATSSFARN